MRVTPEFDTLNTIWICNPADPLLVQTYPAAVFNNENYVVAWTDEKFGGYYTAVARVTPGGAVLDTGVLVSDGVGTSEYRPDIAFDGNRCLIVWPKSSSGIQARFVNNAGQPEDNVFSITTGYAGGPAIDFDGTNYLVVYYAGAYPNSEIYGRLVSPQGQLLGNVIDIATGSGCHRWADVVFDGNDYLVVWQSGDNDNPQYIYGQIVATNGSLVGSSFMISDSTSQRRWYPAIAASDSNYLIAWGQGSTSDVYGNIDLIMGVEQEEIGSSITKQYVGQTIFSGSLKHFAEKGYKLYDISGRAVDVIGLKPGVYFLEKDGQIVEKVIKIR